MVIFGFSVSPDLQRLRLVIPFGIHNACAWLSSGFPMSVSPRAVAIELLLVVSLLFPAPALVRESSNHSPDLQRLRMALANWSGIGILGFL